MPLEKAIQRIENEGLAVNCDWTEDSNYREGLARALEILMEEVEKEEQRILRSKTGYLEYNTPLKEKG